MDIGWVKELGDERSGLYRRDRWVSRSLSRASAERLNPSYLLAAGCFLEILRYYAELWLNQLIVTAFIAEKIWEKHRVRRYEVDEVLAHRQAIRLRHKQDPVRVVVM